MEPNDEPIKEDAMECQVCHKKRGSVSVRPNGYANDVLNDPDAMHQVCDYCDYQNAMDI